MHGEWPVSCLGTIMAIIMSAIVNPSPPESAKPSKSPTERTISPTQESELTKQAISLGLAMVSVPLIWKWLDLPGVLQIGVTSLILLQPDPMQSWRKGILRLLGCMAGGSIGLLLLGSPAGHYIITWGAAYWVLIFCFSYIDHGDPRCSYMGLQGGIALTLTLVQGLGPGTELQPPITRLCGILAGLILWNIIHALFEKDIVSLSKLNNAKVVVLYSAIDLCSYFPAYGNYPDQDRLNDFRNWEVEKARQTLNKLCDEELRSCPLIEIRLTLGNPVTNIIEQAEKENADLIVISSHGLGREKKNSAPDVIGTLDFSSLKFFNSVFPNSVMGLKFFFAEETGQLVVALGETCFAVELEFILQ
ncbi:FUSC family protein, partial [Aduncisulcus paluster]